jgi:hypothetical protein
MPVADRRRRTLPDAGSRSDREAPDLEAKGSQAQTLSARQTGSGSVHAGQSLLQCSSLAALDDAEACPIRTSPGPPRGKGGPGVQHRPGVGVQVSAGDGRVLVAGDALEDVQLDPGVGQPRQSSVAEPVAHQAVTDVVDVRRQRLTRVDARRSPPLHPLYPSLDNLPRAMSPLQALAVMSHRPIKMRCDRIPPHVAKPVGTTAQASNPRLTHAGSVPRPPHRAGETHVMPPRARRYGAAERTTQRFDAQAITQNRLPSVSARTTKSASSGYSQSTL